MPQSMAFAAPNFTKLTAQ